MERTSILQSIDEAHYYLINNAYFSTYYAFGNKSAKSITPKALASTDGYKWAFTKNTDGTVLIKNKLSDTYARVTNDAAEEQLRLGNEYKWTLREVTTDQGASGIAIIDGSGTYSWYTNPSAWNYLLLKPYDWGASIWQLVKTDDEVPTGINEIGLFDNLQSDNFNGQSVNGQWSMIYDLQGRILSAEPQKGIYIIDGQKRVR